SGTSAAEALSAVQAVTRNPLLNQARATEFVKLARDIAAVTGETLPEAQQKLTAALTGGIDAVIKYGFSLNALSAEEAKTIEKTGDLDIAVTAISRRMSGVFKDNLTPFQKAIIDVTAAWNAFIDALSKSPVVSGFLQGLADLMKE